MSVTLIVNEALQLAKKLPFSVMVKFAEAIQKCDFQDWANTRTEIVSRVLQPTYRSLVTQFLDNLQPVLSDILPESISLTLLTAAYSEKERRTNQHLELVWTGPKVGLIPLRQTQQAILQLIESAKVRITIVSYAVYNIPHICEALIKAANRGVQIIIIVETPDRLEGKNAYSTLRSLGTEVATTCEVYFWPLEKRNVDVRGKAGILHVKCAVADGNLLFLSSANLTEYAFTLNMELGVLIAGGSIPSQVEEHFRQSIELGILVQV